MALLVAMVGLMGAIVAQRAAITGTAQANEAQVAMRLAAKALEDFNTRRTQANPFVDMLAPIADGNWSTPQYLNAHGQALPDQSSAYRWQVRTRVTDTGVGLPYNISVEVSYSADGGDLKAVRLDMERRKTW